jgi:hypothetical protein
VIYLKAMKKTLIVTLLLVVLGNTIIMFLEKYFFLKADMNQLQNNLFSATANSDISKIYPPIILSKKIFIWLSTFICINTVLYFLRISNKKIIKFLLIGFYIIACLANVIIVPHPLWFICASIAIVITPFFIIDEIFNYISLFIMYLKKDIKQPHYSNYNSNLS